MSLQKFTCMFFQGMAELWLDGAGVTGSITVTVANSKMNASKMMTVEVEADVQMQMLPLRPENSASANQDILAQDALKVIELGKPYNDGKARF